MSTGISISSINRIKELAEEKKFKEALEILDTQNLDKSINPQFLKISGEIFRENKRYYDSRRILLKAHQMAPQGNRIIYELIQLYLELGYFSKAQKYYEQYMFYTTPEDTQKDYVEYIMKKATGADVKELATILIPILERMPEDRWNFEAILLYHKMDRKDMALEESRYILENFKDSEYVRPVIEYIDDKLDVDEWFYVYPKEEKPEDVELFGDLIEQEEKSLEADYLRMYPPEARIMVEADDNDADEVVPVKEKKPKKLRKKKSKKEAEETVAENVEEQNEDATSEQKKDATMEEKSSTETTTASEDKAKESDDSTSTKSEVDGVKDEAAKQSDSQEAGSETSEAEDSLTAEEQVQQEREAALEKILSKKIDKDKIKESARQVAQAVKDIDKDKAKQQMKSVAEVVKGNVKKASDAIGGAAEAVGIKQATNSVDATSEATIPEEELILDGIIEGVLEPPKKTVGQVVMNEELDALIPDSLEAMSEKEIADIEAKKEEIERLELEALENTLKLEEEKKAKKQAKRNADSSEDELAEEATPQETTSQDADSKVKEEEQKAEDFAKESSSEEDSHDDFYDSIVSKPKESNYTELKNRYIENLEEEKPLESLGFITVVHSDVDEAMEENIPDAADMLRQMIDNKEYYAGENSLGFESKASYENHGFEVEDYDFNTYREKTEKLNEQVEEKPQEQAEEVQEAEAQEDVSLAVQVIFAEESVVAFEDVAIEEDIPMHIKFAEFEEPVFYGESVASDENIPVEEPAYSDEPVSVGESVCSDDSVSVEESVYSYESILAEESIFIEEEISIEEDALIEDNVPVDESVSSGEILVSEEDVSVEEPVLSDELVSEEKTSEAVTFKELNVEEVVSEEPISMGFVSDTESVTHEESISYEASVSYEEPISHQESPLYEDTTSYEELASTEDVDLENIETPEKQRERIRMEIVLSYRMENILLQLKESR